MKRKGADIHEELRMLKNELLKPGYHKSSDLIKVWKSKVSIKTIQRRLNELEKIETGYYLVGQPNMGWRLIEKLLYNKRIKLIKKMVVLNLTPIEEVDIYSDKMRRFIFILYKALEDKKYVTLKNYSPVDSRGSKDYNIYPLSMSINKSVYIVAYDRHDAKKKSFKISRAFDIILEDDMIEQSMQDRLNGEFYVDYFDFNCKKDDLMDIEIWMTNYSKDMAVRDFPQMSPIIFELSVPYERTLNGYVYKFQYSLKIQVGSLRVIGRLMTGMLDNFIVHEAPEKFRQQLNDYIKKTVLDSWEEINNYK